METETKIGIGVLLTLIVTFVYYGDVDREANYYCLDREIKAYCYDLSSTGKTCYTQSDRTGGKRCSSLWKEIPFIETVSIQIDSKANRLHCTSESCV